MRAYGDEDDTEVGGKNGGEEEERQRNLCCKLFALNVVLFGVVGLVLLLVQLSNDQFLELGLPAANGSRIRRLGQLAAGGFEDANAARVCPEKGADLRLLVLVVSGVQNRSARDCIRATWGMGLPRDGSARYAFLVAGGLPGLPGLQFEQRRHGDLILGREPDSASRTLQVLHLFEWVASECPKVQWVLRADDDVYVQLDHALELVERLERGAFYGREGHSDASGWPRFLAGPAYLFPGEVAHSMHLVALQAPFFPQEEVLFTGAVAERLGLQRLPLDTFVFASCGDQQFAVRPRLTPNAMVVFHAVLQEDLTATKLYYQICSLDIVF